MSLFRQVLEDEIAFEAYRALLDSEDVKPLSERGADQKTTENYDIISDFDRELLAENWTEYLPSGVGTVAQAAGVGVLLGTPLAPLGVGLMPLVANSAEETANAYYGYPERSGFLRELAIDALGRKGGNLSVDTANVAASLPAVARLAKVGSEYIKRDPNNHVVHREPRIYSLDAKGNPKQHIWEGLESLTRPALTLEALLAALATEKVRDNYVESQRQE